MGNELYFIKERFVAQGRKEREQTQTAMNRIQGPPTGREGAPLQPNQRSKGTRLTLFRFKVIFTLQTLEWAELNVQYESDRQTDKLTDMVYVFHRNPNTEPHSNILYIDKTNETGKKVTALHTLIDHFKTRVDMLHGAISRGSQGWGMGRRREVPSCFLFY